MKKILSYGLIIVLLISCQAHNAKEECPSLTVDLTDKPAAFSDVFSKIDFIPLETTDSCLLIGIDKLMQSENNFYVFDSQRPALYVFDKSGKFIQQIAKEGDGPGEYQLIYDFTLDKRQKHIILLSPYGYLQRYDANGNFIDKQILPVKPNYYSLACLNRDCYAFWSCVDQSEEGITLVEKATGKPVAGYWHNDRILDMGRMRPFYEYSDSLYFTTAYQNVVYKITKENLIPAYQWDFGEQGISDKRIQKYLNIGNDGKRNEQLLKDLEDGSLPFCIQTQCQNDRYYFVALQKGLGTNDHFINVFYNKANGRSYLFDNSIEGMRLRPLLLTDEYVLSVLYPTDAHEPFRSYLSEEAYAKLTSLKDDDNPCLVQYYFN